MNQRFLIVGASGFIGSHLYSRLGPKRAIATYHRTPVPGGIHFDAASMRLADSVLRPGHRLTHAFLLQGIGNLDACARDPVGTGRTNVEGMCRLIDELSAAGVKVVFTSSDAVFDGTKGSWTEEDAPNPILTYGKQKVAVERHLSGKAQPWIIARLSKVVGSDSGHHSLFGEWMEKIDNGETIKCAGDLIFTPIHVDDVASSLVALATGEFSGIFNVCGPRSMSRLDLLNLFLAHVREHRKVNVEVVPCSIRDFPFLEERGLNGSMIPDTLFAALGSPCEDMESVCARIAAARYGAAAKRPKGITA